MRLLKWLFQPAYLLLIIVLVALYVNREALFPEEVAASLEAEALVAKVEKLTERLRSHDEPGGDTPIERQEGIQDDSSQAVDADAVVESPLEVEERSAEVEQSPTVVEEEGATTISEPSTAMTATAGASGAASPSQLQETQVPMGGETGEIEIPAALTELPAEPVVEAMAAEVTLDVAEEAVAPEVPPAPMEPIAPSEASGVPQSEQPLPLDAWRAARAAVWQGDLEVAVTQYRRLIAVQPDNFDAYGEMGNVLLAQSNVEAAVEAYASAARLIRQAGHREMAYRVASIVARLDEEQGRALYEEFSR